MICDADCENRYTYVECTEYCCRIGPTCTNREITCGIRPPVEVFNTIDKGYGLRVTSPVAKGTLIIEYIGEYIPVKLHRATIDSEAPIYGMETGTGFVIDATRYGNHARFINHACFPNADVEKWETNKSPRVIIRAKRMIHANEEITMDYGLYKVMNQSFSCLCQNENCRKVL